MERLFTVEELINKKLDALTLLKFEKKTINGRVRNFWVCRCECGNIVSKEEHYLVSRENKCHTCNHNCPFFKRKVGAESSRWTGIGSLSGGYFAALVHGAKNRNKSFEITIEQAWDLFLKQNRKCALTNRELCFLGQRLRKKNGEEQTASLDRIDPKIGYTLDNIQWVHKEVNRMRNSYTLEEFYKVCEDVLFTKFKKEGLPQRFLNLISSEKS